MEIRTKNPSEIKIYQQLKKEGYSILKNGFPDFVVYKDDSIRFIEVKKSKNSHLSRRQGKMATILKQLGINVEVMYGNE